MINRSIYILFISVLSSIMISCNNQDIYGNDSNSGLNISAEINNPDIDNIVQKTRFEVDDTIGVYMVDYLNGNPDKIGSINNFMNEMYVFDGHYWRNSNSQLTLTDPYTLADAYAYYPYDKEMSGTWDKLNLEVYPFEVESNQQNTLKKSDFLWAKYDAISATNTTIKFSFKRLLSKIIINISSNNENTDIDSFFIRNLITNCTIDMNNGKVIAKDKILPIKPHQETEINSNLENTVSAIVIPQNIKKDTPLFYITINNKMYAYISDQDFSLEQGYAYEFNLDINILDTRSINDNDNVIYKPIHISNIYNY